MQNYKTETEIKEHILKLIEARKPTQDQAHEEFNKGVKFATDYILEFINTKRMTVFIQKEQKELVAKIEKALELSSCPALGNTAKCPAGKEYKTFINGAFKEEGEAVNMEPFSIDKQIEKVVDSITEEYKDILNSLLIGEVNPRAVQMHEAFTDEPFPKRENYCIYWRVYPTYETTNTGTYLRMRLTIDRKVESLS